ncbi:MAG TPA: SDR family oxidoreductase [Dehalococcoidia bacterium]|nr:SDR family oxidoreductase [Dehalococcoidia bacterium]
MTGDLAGQVAVVTGAGRGFGRAIAERLAREGASVAITARSRDELNEVASSIAASGGKAIAVPGDVTRREDVARVKAETESKLGDVSILVHNAGVPWPFGPTWEVDPDTWWEAQQVHVKAAMYFISAFVPGMVERWNGRVVVVASTAGTAPRPNLSGYAVAKATQIRLMEHLALEGKEHGVYAWSIQPGSVFTGISVLTMADPAAQKYLPDFVNRLKNQRESDDPTIGLNRCAEMVSDLASGRCDILSGRYLTPQDDFAALVQEAKAKAV